MNSLETNKPTTATEQAARYSHIFYIVRQKTTTQNHSATKMPPPSKVAIATGSVLRLVKEEASYHKEIVQQEERIKKLEESTGDSNKEYTLKQEVLIVPNVPCLRHDS
jgi:hypothetical protein